MKPTEIAIAIVVRDGKILICRRLADGVLGGCWEFPGGKLESGESPQQCAVREVREEVALTIRVERGLPTIDYVYPHGLIRLHPLLCRYESGEVECRACQEARWIVPQALRDYRFPPANDSLIEQLITPLDNAPRTE